MASRLPELDVRLFSKMLPEKKSVHWELVNIVLKTLPQNVEMIKSLSMRLVTLHRISEIINLDVLPNPQPQLELSMKSQFLEVFVFMLVFSTHGT